MNRQARPSVKQLINTRKGVKRDFYQGYKKLREGQYEYVHEFKERID